MQTHPVRHGDRHDNFLAVRRQRGIHERLDVGKRLPDGLKVQSANSFDRPSALRLP